MFALPLTDYPELVQTQREIKLADQLFTLYVDVLGTLSNWKSVLWSDVTKQIGKLMYHYTVIYLYYHPVLLEMSYLTSLKLDSLFESDKKIFYLTNLKHHDFNLHTHSSDS